MDSEELKEFGKLMSMRRAGKRVEISKEVMKAVMDEIRSRRGERKGGRPRVVEHSEVGRCRCVECRKKRGEAPYRRGEDEVRFDWGKLGEDLDD